MRSDRAVFIITAGLVDDGVGVGADVDAAAAAAASRATSLLAGWPAATAANDGALVTPPLLPSEVQVKGVAAAAARRTLRRTRPLPEPPVGWRTG